MCTFIYEYNNVFDEIILNIGLDVGFCRKYNKHNY